MHRLLAVGPVLTVMVISACASPSRSAPDAGVSAEGGDAPSAGVLRDRESSFFAALSDGNPERIAAHFADDASLHIANMPPMRGRDAIAGFYSNLLRFLSATTATPETLRVSRSGDMGYTTGAVTSVFEGGEGRAEYPGKYVLVWERRGAEWVIVLHGVSSNQSDADGGV